MHVSLLEVFSLCFFIGLCAEPSQSFITQIGTYSPFIALLALFLRQRATHHNHIHSQIKFIPIEKKWSIDILLNDTIAFQIFRELLEGLE